MSTATISAERERIRAALLKRQLGRQARALQSIQVAERQSEREALAEVLASGRIMRENAAGRRAMREQAVARRRDELNRALAYPVGAEELRDLCQSATLQGKVPASAFEDVSQALAEHVIRRYGPNPERARIGAQWLRTRAVAIHIDQQRATERATGQRAAADQLADWRDQDHRAAMADAAAAGDPVWALAAHQPAVVNMRPISPEIIARWLDLPAKQAEALALAINTRRIRPMTNAERFAWHSVRGKLRERYPDAAALLLAIRPDSYAARTLADAAIRAERRRAAVASRGSGAPGRRDSASARPLARFQRPTAAMPAPPPATVGPTAWERYGDGYSGSCSVLYLYRPGGRRRAAA